LKKEHEQKIKGVSKEEKEIMETILVIKLEILRQMSKGAEDDYALSACFEAVKSFNMSKQAINYSIVESKDAGHTKDQTIARLNPLKLMMRECQDIIRGYED
jgi:hypothetical protein